jgi:Bacteriophage HK97-gp10, putative tail-component
VSVQWDGLDELRAALLNLPADLTADASVIVEETADAAAADIRAAYPAREGDLKDGVEVTKIRTAEFATAAFVVNTVKYASWFEAGTQVRHYGAASRGAMPARPTFIPRVIRHRRVMYGRLAEMLRQHGLLVSGDGT